MRQIVSSLDHQRRNGTLKNLPQMLVEFVDIFAPMGRTATVVFVILMLLFAPTTYFG